MIGPVLGGPCSWVLGDRSWDLKIHHINYDGIRRSIGADTTGIRSRVAGSRLMSPVESSTTPQYGPRGVLRRFSPASVKKKRLTSSLSRNVPPCRGGKAPSCVPEQGILHQEGLRAHLKEGKPCKKTRARRARSLGRQPS
jgi:hypothetical protein